MLQFRVTLRLITTELKEWYCRNKLHKSLMSHEAVDSGGGGTVFLASLCSCPEVVTI
jgi:hypothetical protein